MHLLIMETETTATTTQIINHHTVAHSTNTRHTIHRRATTTVQRTTNPIHATFQITPRLITLQEGGRTTTLLDSHLRLSNAGRHKTPIHRMADTVKARLYPGRWETHLPRPTYVVPLDRVSLSQDSDLNPGRRAHRTSQLSRTIRSERMDQGCSLRELEVRGSGRSAKVKSS